jgi:hypothetical protein
MAGASSRGSRDGHPHRGRGHGCAVHRCVGRRDHRGAAWQVRRAAELGALANALRARAVNGEPIDIGELARIESIAGDAINALGIAPAQPRTGHIDLQLLSDDEIDALEAMHMKAGVPGPLPEGDHATINDLLVRIEKQREQIACAEDRARIAEEAERAAIRLRDAGVEAAHELQRRLQEVEAALWTAQHPDPQQNARVATTSRRR